MTRVQGEWIPIFIHPRQIVNYGGHFNFLLEIKDTLDDSYDFRYKFSSWTTHPKSWVNHAWRDLPEFSEGKSGPDNMQRGMYILTPIAGMIWYVHGRMVDIPPNSRALRDDDFWACTRLQVCGRRGDGGPEAVLADIDDRSRNYAELMFQP